MVRSEIEETFDIMPKKCNTVSVLEEIMHKNRSINFIIINAQVFLTSSHRLKEGRC